MVMRAMASGVLVAWAVTCFAGCSQKKEDGADGKVTTLGTVEITAKLVDVGGEYMKNDLYDYVQVMKYEVLQTHRGKVDGKTIYIAQYNPLKPRASVADERAKDVGGNVGKFVVGDVHRMALEEPPLEDRVMVGIVNRFAENASGPTYNALWTNRVDQ